MLVWFAAANGGFDGTTWYPGALFVLGLVLVAALAVRAPGLAVPRLVVVAIVALAAYAAWSYLSIGWAHQKGDAWDGANRSLLYTLVFALFALWRPRARPATFLLVAFALGVSVIGLVELLRAAGAEDPRSFFIEGRFASPAGYMNANVALWTAALVPCVALGARRELAPALRGVLVAAAVLLGGLAVIGQSRGWFFTAPIAVIAFIAITPRRVRTTLTLALVLGATGVVGPTLLDVYQSAGTPAFAGAVSDAARAILLAALVAGIVAVMAAEVDQRARRSETRDRRAGRGLGSVLAAAAVIGLVGFVAANGSPFTALSDAWAEFKTQPSPTGGASRLSALGSNRYDFWRVAWGRFEAAPVAGIGADNFQQDYLRERRSLDEPRYPHSVELRALSQTGLIGAALLFTAIGSALTAAILASRRRTGLGAAVAAAGAASFVYWLLHGSVDWFWEFPALAAPAFALLGLGAGLLPRSPAAARPPRGARPAWRAAVPVAGVVAAVVIALAMALPWLALLEQHRAATIWRTDAKSAFERLDKARSLNPLSVTPDLTAGSIALRLKRYGEAERHFRGALERDPRDAYSHLELGMVLGNTGRRAEALRILAAGARLDPRDDIAAEVRRRVRRGKRVDIDLVNRRLVERAVERVR